MDRVFRVVTGWEMLHQHLLTPGLSA
jgi:hypothetical protein